MFNRLLLFFFVFSELLFQIWGLKIGTSVHELSDFSLIVTGNNLMGDNDLYIAKFKTHGHLIWERNIVSDSNIYGNSVVEQSSGVILVYGTLYGYSAELGDSSGSSDVLICSFSSTDGTIVVSNNYGDADVQLGESLIKTSDDNFVVTGFFAGTIDFGGGPLVAVYGTTDIFAASLDSSGNHLWSISFGQGEGMDVCEKDGYIFVCKTGVAEYSLYIHKVDVYGSFIWDETISSDAGNSVYGESIIDTNDEAFAVVGRVKGTSLLNANIGVSDDYDVFIAKFNQTDGTLLWSYAFEGNSNENSESVIYTSDDCFVFTGYFNGVINFGGKELVSSDSELFLVKLDNNGNHIWSTSLQKSNDQEAHSVFETYDGGYVVTGADTNLTNEVLLLKYSKDGVLLWSTSDGIIDDCDDNCDICSDPSTCLECSGDYYMHNDICYENCSFSSIIEYGFYDDDSDSNSKKCSACEEFCSICNNSTYCVDCNPQYYLLDGDCNTTCPIGYFKDDSVSPRICSECGLLCEYCINSSVCSDCGNEYLLNGECYINCPSNYVNNPSVSPKVCDEESVDDTDDTGDDTDDTGDDDTVDDDTVDDDTVDDDDGQELIGGIIGAIVGGVAVISFLLIVVAILLICVIWNMKKRRKSVDVELVSEVKSIEVKGKEEKEGKKSDSSSSDDSSDEGKKV